MLYIVGYGCGSRNGMTYEAENAIKNSELIVGYSGYVELLKNYFPEKTFYDTGMKKETERVKYALEKAAGGIDVSIICSGDSEIYGMAGLAYEMSENYPDVTIRTIAGVTAALSGGALLGSPLTNDFAVISLSDLLTPFEKVKKRVEYAAKADLVIVIYNPVSKAREANFREVCALLQSLLPCETVCGYAKNIGRKNEECRIFRLKELDTIPADMFTTIFIGNSETKIINGKMVTPRGYKNV